MPVADTSPFQFYGAQAQYAKLQTMMRAPEGVQIVAGPPGTMKTTMIKRAALEAGLKVQTIDMEHQSTEKLVELIRKLSSSTLSDPGIQSQSTLWLVNGAEILPANAAPVWKAGATMMKLRIVLEMTDVPHSLRTGAGKLDILFFNRVSGANVKHFLSDNGVEGAALTRAVEAAQGDLHQAKLAAAGWSVRGLNSSGKDTVPHLWFDTKQVVNPGSRPLPADRVDPNWVQHNALPRMLNLEQAAVFAETCAFTDGGCPYGERGDIMQMALRQTARSWGARVENPPSHPDRHKSLVRGQQEELLRLRQQEEQRPSKKRRVTEPAAPSSGTWGQARPICSAFMKQHTYFHICIHKAN